MMSKYFSKKYADLEPYVPGEQPQDMQYIKLNTNESPFESSGKVQQAVAVAAKKLQRYPDPNGYKLKARIAEHLTKKEKINLSPKNILLSNGSDEALNYAFMAYCDSLSRAIFPEITYGFYKVFAEVNNVSYQEIPLDCNFRINPEDYNNIGGTIFIANPNAHTGICLSKKQIENIIETNSENVVIIDEAYVDFGAESCVSLVNQLDNLLVIQTLSKSRSFAGGRLGYAIGNEKLICDLETIRNSTNPYNINTMTMAAGVAVFDDEEYTAKNCKEIIKNREYTTSKLQEMGFTLTDSQANFIFMKHPTIDGTKIYMAMKENGVLIRHFNKDRISQYNRVTIGSREQMVSFIQILKRVLGELG